MKKFVTIAIIGMFALAFAANADNNSFLEQLDKAGVNYVYSTEGRLRILVTEDTAEKVDELVSSKPKDLDLEVVEYRLGEE